MFFEYQGFGIFPCHCAGGEYHQGGSAAFCHAFCAFPPGLCGRRRSCVPGCSGAGPSQPFCPLLQGRRALLGQAALEAGRTPSEKQNKTPRGASFFQGAPRGVLCRMQPVCPWGFTYPAGCASRLSLRAGGGQLFARLVAARKQHTADAQCICHLKVVVCVAHHHGVFFFKAACGQARQGRAAPCCGRRNR